MPNTIITPTIMTREALRILHQKLTFCGNTNRQYDNRFANTGASVSGKIGPTLQIRLPNRYGIRIGSPMGTVRDVEDQKVDLTASSIYGVDMEFSDSEMALSIQDFSDRHLKPAMSVLAANIEAMCFKQAYREIYSQVGVGGAAPPTSLLAYLNAGARLDNNLAPMDDERFVQSSPEAQASYIDSQKGLFQASDQISKSYKQGIIGTAAGFDFYRNTLVPTHVNGTQASWTVTNANPSGNQLAVSGLTAGQTIRAGTVFTIAGAFEVHPETRDISSRLQQFVVTTDFTAAAATGTIAISPSIVPPGGSANNSRQNVSAAIAAGAVCTMSAAASASYPIQLAHHKDAFAFVTADLEIPKGTDAAAREQFEGISMRYVSDFDTLQGRWLRRIDVLWGFKTIRPEFACRVTS